MDDVEAKEAVVISGDEMWALALVYMGRDHELSVREALALAAVDLIDVKDDPVLVLPRVKGAHKFEPLAHVYPRAVAPMYRKVL